MTKNKIPLEAPSLDDIRAAAEFWPPLTTVRVDKRAMGKTAAQRLFQKMDSKTTVVPPHETFFPTELVVRGSTAKPRE